MNKWPRRLLYLLFIVVWLVLLSFPFFAFSLAARGQLQVGEAPENHVRVFLIQEPDAEGIGVETARTAASDNQCLQTSIRYFMWSGPAESVQYCQCTDPDSGHLLSATQGRCNAG